MLLVCRAACTVFDKAYEFSYVSYTLTYLLLNALVPDRGITTLIPDTKIIGMRSRGVKAGLVAAPLCVRYNGAAKASGVRSLNI